jgi:benzoylformate decarboxylase
MKIAELLLRTLEANGVRHIFGNPGTTEIPLVRMCEHREKLRYVVALSEVAAVPMADGYARATRGLGVVNLHVAPGLGNGSGALYTAGIAGTPLLVLVGGQDRRFLHTQPILYGPLEAMAGPVTKAVYTLTDAASAEFYIRKAIRAALTPPTGPVALICPPDLLEEEIDGAAQFITVPSLGGLASEDVHAYAAFLGKAKKPALIATEDVHWANACGELQRLAESLGAPVYVAPYTGILPIAASSHAYAGYLSPSRTSISKQLAGHDALLLVGGTGLRTTLFSDAELPQRKAWLGTDADFDWDENEFELARIADLKHALARLADATRSSRAEKTAARPPLKIPAAGKTDLHPTRAVDAILQAFPRALLVDESGLSTSDVKALMHSAGGEYLINGSGGIGWGLAAAMGAAIGQASRQIVALIGDGSALYASEAMWSAAHYSARVLLVVFSNRRYATLNEAAARITGHELDLFTIEPPVMDFSGLAKLYGWNYASVATESELTAFLAANNTSMGANTLLDLKLDPKVKPVTAARHF